MADPVIPDAADLPIAPNGEVKAYDRLGNKVTVPKDKVGELYGMGGRVALKKEVVEQQLQADYDKKSTGEKVGGAIAGLAAGPIASNALSGAGVITTAPQVQAYEQGVSSAITGGLDQIAVKKALEVTAGTQAASAYGRHQLDVADAHGDYKTAGQVVGFGASALAGGGLGAASKAIPGLGISAAGGAIEGATASVLAPVAARGALGRALTTGASLGMRGAIEGALYSGANQITEDSLGDKEIVADKVFASMGTGALYGGAGGFALGAGGSLAASGARATLGAGRGALGRALARSETAATDAAAVAEKEPLRLHGEQPSALHNPEQPGPKPPMGEGVTVEAPTPGALQRTLSGDGDAVVRAKAADLAYDALGATKNVAKKINERTAGGTNAVGEYVNRRVLNTVGEDASLMGTLRGGRADNLLPIIKANLATDGAKVGDIVQATSIRVEAGDLIANAAKIQNEMLGDTTRRAGAEAFQKQVGHTFDALGHSGKVSEGKISLSDMYYERAKMEGVAYEMAGKDKAAGAAFKEWLRDVDAYLVNKIDDAARAMGDTGKREELLGLKRELTLGHAAEKAAAEGADRIAGNNSFGLREGIGGMVGLATGHPLAAIGAALAGKVARERGSAAGAYLLTKMADMKVVSRAVQGADDQLGRSAKGLLSAPSKRPLPEPASTVPLRTQAAAVMDRAAKVQANPEGLASAIAAHTDVLQANAPNLAMNLGARMTSAYALLASKIPTHADPDPFDPHPAARLSDAQAATVVRYGAYIERPMRFFEEVEHGKLTHEGVDVARILMPGMFAELQQRTVEGLADLMARGKAPPFAQRQRLGILLDIPAVPSQRPDHMLFLQSNVAPAASAPKPSSAGASGPKRPIATKSQPSTLDRLEGR